MSEYEFTVSLRIRHPTIDPQTISDTLGIQPLHTWRAGRPRCDLAGAEIGGAHHDSYWMARLMENPQLSSDGVSVERVIVTTLSQLRRAQTFLEQLHAEGGLAALLVSLYARADFRLELPADSLTLLGRMHMAVVLDVHPHSPLKARQN